MKTVICDLDDVLWNLVDAWISWYNLYNPQIDIIYKDKDDITDWDIEKCVNPKDKKFFWNILNNSFFWKHIVHFTSKETYDSLRELNDNPNIKLYIATASCPQNATMKLMPFLSYFDFIDSKQVIIIQDKDLLNGDIFIDDSPHNLKKYIEKGGKCYCINKAWNKNIEESENCKKMDKFELVAEDILNNINLSNSYSN